MRFLWHDLLLAGLLTLALSGGIAYLGAADAGINLDDVMICH